MQDINFTGKAKKGKIMAPSYWTFSEYFHVKLSLHLPGKRFWELKTSPVRLPDIKTVILGLLLWWYNNVFNFDANILELTQSVVHED